MVTLSNQKKIKKILNTLYFMVTLPIKKVLNTFVVFFLFFFFVTLSNKSKATIEHVTVDGELPNQNKKTTTKTQTS